MSQAFSLLFVLIAGVIPSIEAKPAVEQPHPEVEAVLMSMVKERRGLFSGDFEAIGQIVQRNPGVPTEIAHRRVDCAFDEPKNLLRFDTDGQILIDVRSSSELNQELLEQVKSRKFASAPTYRPLQSAIIRNGEYSTEWYAVGTPDDSNHATCNFDLHSPDAPILAPMFSSYFDLHTLGLGFRPQQVERMFTLDDYISFFRKFFLTSEVAQVGEMTVLTMTRYQSKATIVLNPQRGMTLEKSEMLEFDDAGVQKEYPRFTTATQWDQRGGTWVPIRFSTADIISADRERRIEYDINWKSVNTPVADLKRFTYKDVSFAWKGRYVFDRRDGKVDHIDTIGEPFQKIGAATDAEEALQEIPLGSRDKMRGWLLYTNLLAILLVVLFFWLRQRKEKVS